MKYYTKKNKGLKKLYLIVILITIITIFSMCVYFFNKRVFPSVLKISEINYIYSNGTKTSMSFKVMRSGYSYDNLIIIDKDSNNNINLIRANTIKLNFLTSKLSSECNKKLQEMGTNGLDVPLGWIAKNSTFYHLGPKINVGIEPIGNVEISYDSKFESAGINQTRHKIYLDVKATMRIKVPMNSEEIKVKCEIPISETIIVGKIPDTAIGFGNK